MQSTNVEYGSAILISILDMRVINFFGDTAVCYWYQSPGPAIKNLKTWGGVLLKNALDMA